MVAAVGHSADLGYTETDMHQVMVACAVAAARIADSDRLIVHGHPTDGQYSELEAKNIAPADAVVPSIDEVRS